MGKLAEGIRCRGFFRVQIGAGEGKNAVVVGDSGWIPNTVTNDGLNNYIAGSVGANAGSKQVSHLQLATQTATVNATQASLLGEVYARAVVSPSTIATGTLQVTASWSSSLITAATTIGALGLYNTSSAGTLGAGQTFATSQIQTNQNFSGTYQLRFS